MKTSLYENAKSIVRTAEDFEKQAYSFIKLLFEWEKENRPKIVIDELRRQIELAEFKWIKQNRSIRS